MTCRDVFFAGVPGAVRLHDCGGLLSALDEFFRLWPHAPRPEGLPSIPGFPGTFPPALHGAAPLLEIAPQERGYRLRSPWLPAPRHEPSGACLLCSLAIELVAACCHACPRPPCRGRAPARAHPAFLRRQPCRQEHAGRPSHGRYGPGSWRRHAGPPSGQDIFLRGGPPLASALAPFASTGAPHARSPGHT